MASTAPRLQVAKAKNAATSNLPGKDGSSSDVSSGSPIQVSSVVQQIT